MKARSTSAKEHWLIYGGSFDPPHIGHLLAASWGLAQANAVGVVVVPSYNHPDGKRAVASFEHRLEMCRLAFSPLRQVEVSGVESGMAGPGYTIDVVHALQELYPVRSFDLLVGADAAESFETWHRAGELEALIELQVVGRGDGAMAIPDISSTAIRSALAQEADVVEGLSLAVSNYIRGHRLYGNGSKSCG